ncbi:MAG: hypothetical protein JRJ85_01920 [Deltaproteobacteria bacterium]|nr:hypothetical protein [Deltaproteobacteria bacterium]
MERTTIMMPGDLKIKALKRASMMGISLGQFIRESIEKSLDDYQKNRPMDDPLFSDDAVCHGKIPRDLAENHDKYIYGE